MNRGSTTAFQQEVVKSANRPVHLVEVIFDDENVYMNDCYKTITYDGNDYIGVGHFLGFSDIVESVEVIVSTVTLSLSGVDGSMISRFLNKEYIDRTVKIYTAFLDSSQDLIADPVLILKAGWIPLLSQTTQSKERLVCLFQRLIHGLTLHARQVGIPTMKNNKYFSMAIKVLNTPLKLSKM